VDVKPVFDLDYLANGIKVQTQSLTNQLQFTKNSEVHNLFSLKMGKYGPTLLTKNQNNRLSTRGNSTSNQITQANQITAPGSKTFLELYNNQPKNKTDPIQLG
jgi:predicted Zn-dependent protease